MLRIFGPIAAAGATCLALTAIAPGAAKAQPGVEVVHPIYASLASLRNSAHDAEAHRAFADAAARYKLGPVEVMDVPAPPAPLAPERLRAGVAALEKLRFEEAQAALDAGVVEALATGGAGLDPVKLQDLFINQAIAAQRADWKDLAAPPREIASPKAREAYVRAAVLGPDRVLLPRRYPPLAVASFPLATAEVKARPRGDLVVRAAPHAEVSIDAGPPLLSPATARGLPYGEHLIRVEQPGQAPWAAVVTLALPVLEIDAPSTAPLLVADADAAARARQMGAAYALVAQMKKSPALEVEVRLIDAASGELQDAVVVPFPRDAGALDAAVMRLDETARRREHARRGGTRLPAAADLTIGTVPAGRAPSPADPPEDAGTWLRRRWPLATAVGLAVGTALALGLVVSLD